MWANDNLFDREKWWEDTPWDSKSISPFFATSISGLVEITQLADTAPMCPPLQ
jgi:hypothetical protein